MGIRFYCPACSKKVNVKDQFAGLRGYCPKCSAKIDIPLASTRQSKRAAGQEGRSPQAQALPGAVGDFSLSSVLPRVGRLLAVRPTAPMDPLDEAPQLQWYVASPGGSEPFGPADATLFKQWINEGRVAATSLVWRQDWPDWRKAGLVWWRLTMSVADAVDAQAARLAAARPEPRP